MLSTPNGVERLPERRALDGLRVGCEPQCTRYAANAVHGPTWQGDLVAIVNRASEDGVPERGILQRGIAPGLPERPNSARAYQFLREGALPNSVRH